jgi:hypothetical protein
MLLSKMPVLLKIELLLKRTLSNRALAVCQCDTVNVWLQLKLLLAPWTPDLSNLSDIEIMTLLDNLLDVVNSVCLKKAPVELKHLLLLKPALSDILPVSSKHTDELKTDEYLTFNEHEKPTDSASFLVPDNPSLFVNAVVISKFTVSTIPIVHSRNEESYKWVSENDPV